MSSSRPISSPTSNSHSNSPEDSSTVNANNNRQPGPPPSDLPKPKRIACVVCRKRKLRCDGKKPSCGTCNRLGHDCAYDEVRRKSGPKRGYVKALEARLAQVETLLKDQNGNDRIPRMPESSLATSQLREPPMFRDSDTDTVMGGSSTTHESMPPHIPTSFAGATPPLDGDLYEDHMNWDMMATGLEEPLPPQDTMAQLHSIFFEKIYPSTPIIHKARYYASMNLAPHMQPPIFLRYAMWALAASISDDHAGMQTHFYRRARKYLEDAEMKGHGEGVISVASSQAWSLLTCYEFKMMYFPRAWMSTGRAVRLAQMMGLHRLDGVGLEVKQCLPAPKDWIEREERRRTFWMAFCLDRYASIGTGWPMNIDERDILSNLPTSDDSFDKGRPTKTLPLKEAMTSDGAALLSAFGGVCLMAHLFGKNLVHLHRPDPDERDDDLNGEFWKRHRSMDNVLLSIALALPQHFRLPGGMNEPNVVFTNMNIHTSTICLHQAAIFKADKNRMPSSVSAESKIRCITAAAEIASIMRMVCHLDLSGMNPFISFCLYVAARVFVQYLKSRPGDEQVRSSLQFLLTAMGHIKKKNPLTESFLVQLDVDLTGSLDDPNTIRKFPYAMKKGVDEPPIPSCAAAPYTPPVTELPSPERLPYARTNWMTPSSSVPVPVTQPASYPSPSNNTSSMPTPPSQRSYNTFEYDNFSVASISTPEAMQTMEDLSSSSYQTAGGAGAGGGSSSTGKEQINWGEMMGEFSEDLGQMQMPHPVHPFNPMMASSGVGGEYAEYYAESTA